MGEFDMIRHRYNLNGGARRGFTLIELLVVIVILGVLTAIAVPIYLNQRVAAWKATVVSDVHSAAEQVELASYHGDGSLTQLSAYHDARAAADDTADGSPTIRTDKTFPNADGKYDGHDTIGSEPVPVSAGNTTEIQVKSDNSYTIYGVNANVHGWVYRYDSARGAGEWEHGSYPSDPSAPDPDDDCPVVLDGTRLIIGKDGMRCKLSTSMVNAVVGGNREAITEIDLHGHIVIVDGSCLFSEMPSLTSIPYLPGQSVTSSVNGVSYSSMFLDDYKLADADSISHWDTRNVMDMSWMFLSAYTFNQPISNFDTSKVTDMSHMFHYARAFNQSVSNFNTSNVVYMGGMFFGAYVFNQPVSNFNTSKVTDMWCMFYEAYAFNQSVSSFDTRNVTDMSHMFHSASEFNQPVSNFDTRNVTDMSHMFAGARAFNQSVSKFDTSKVTDMEGMFDGATAFDQSVSNFDTRNVTDMSYMFDGARAFNQSVSNFDTGNVTSMSHMFYGASAFNQPVSNFNTSNVVYMYLMFANAYAFNQDLTGWNVANVTDHEGFSTGSALTAAHLPHFTS
jgi:prepilin-type N-terminal cleavage/methylation domain-containing protein